MKFEAVLFDLDGTLFNSVQDIAEAVNDALAFFELPVHKVQDYQYFVGDGFKNLIMRVLPDNLQNDEILSQKVFEQARKQYLSRMDRHSRPYPQIDNMLDELTKRGFRLAVLSNKPHPQTVQLVQKHFSRWRFEVVFGARPEVHPIKPNPAAALEVSQLMKLPTQKFLYLGDTSTDMKTANAAGMWAVGVLWGFRPRQELEEHGGRWFLQNPMQLFDYLS